MPKKGNSFDDDLKRMEQIVLQLESGLDIEEAIKLYEEGFTLSKSLEKRLGDIERKVYQVKSIETVDENADEKIDLELFK